MMKRVRKRETHKGKGQICPVCRIERGIKHSLVVNLNERTNLRGIKLPVTV